MSNHADSFKKSAENYVFPRQKSTTLQETLARVMNTRSYDALVTALDSDYGNRYTIDIYAKGFAEDKTHEGIRAVALNPTAAYQVGWPMKVIYDGQTAYAVPSTEVYCLHVTEKSGHKVTGYIGNADGEQPSFHGTTAYKIHWAYGWSQKDEWNFDGVDTEIPSDLTIAVGLMFPSPTIVDEDSSTHWLAAGFVLTGGEGSSLPSPTEKYQVYTPVDDTLIPIWTTVRFM